MELAIIITTATLIFIGSSWVMAIVYKVFVEGK